MLRKKIIIINKLGLHARAAAKLMNVAGRFLSEISIQRGDQKANGKSIMGLMMLAANQGSELEIIINGTDEMAALTALEDLINNRFGENE